MEKNELMLLAFCTQVSLSKSSFRAILQEQCIIHFFIVSYLVFDCFIIKHCFRLAY